MPAIHDARSSSGTPQIGACKHAVILAQVYPATGQIIQFVSKRCNTSSFENCRPCAELWHGDALHIGLDGLKRPNSTYFRATLTLPSVGRFHFHDKHGAERCGCGTLHEPGDPLVGTPLGPVDYDLLVRQNAALPQLWARTSERLAREVKRLFGAAAKLDWFATVEPHQSLSRHIHAVFRIDQPPLAPGLTQEDLAEKLLAVINATAIQRKLGTREAKSYQWGARNEFKLLTDPLTETSIIYLLKSIGRQRTRAEQLSEQQSQHLDRVQRAARQLASDRYLLGEVTKSVAHRHERKSEDAGYTGHTLLKSGDWSELSFTGLRAKRRAYASQKRTARSSCASSGTIWMYLGKGSSASAERLLHETNGSTEQTITQLHSNSEQPLYPYSLFPHAPHRDAFLASYSSRYCPETRSRAPLSALV